MNAGGVTSTEPSLRLLCDGSLPSLPTILYILHDSRGMNRLAKFCIDIDIISHNKHWSSAAESNFQLREFDNFVQYSPKWNSPLLVSLVSVANQKAQDQAILQGFPTQKRNCSLWKLLFFIQQYETRHWSQTYYCGWLVRFSWFFFADVLKIFNSLNLLCFINFRDVLLQHFGWRVGRGQ